MCKVEQFSPIEKLKTPVLFLVFNRLDTTKRVFEAIRQAKPSKLYIAADGARSNREGEPEKVKAVRDYVLSNIDWDCSIKTLFHDKNLGCKYAVSSAITWFFEQEEMGIILEDDCLPSQSFFWFCEELLELYKDDMRVWHIGGSNFQNGIKRGKGDYYFSEYIHVWGWASWANRWEFYDAELHYVKNSTFLFNIFNEKSVRKYWTEVFQSIKKNKIDTWDYQWVFTIWSNNGLAIIPNFNLISNVGFGIEATHTKNHESPKETFNFTITNHPSKLSQDKKADDFTFKYIYKPKSLWKRIKNKLINGF